MEVEVKVPMEIDITEKSVEKKEKVEEMLESSKMEVDIDSESATVDSPSTLAADSSSTLTADSKWSIPSSPGTGNDKVEEDKATDESVKSIRTVRLSYEGAIDDPNESFVTMTKDEVIQYIAKKVVEYMDTPTNPLYALKEKAMGLLTRGKEIDEEFVKLYKMLLLLQKKHEGFLRARQILPKVSVAHACISADLPVQQLPNPEAFIKKDLSITKIDTPSKNTPGSQSSSTAKKPSAKPEDIECIDLTDDTEPTPSTSAAANRPGLANMNVIKHPAPLPPRPFSSAKSMIPPRPKLKIFSEEKGIVLQWDMPPNPDNKHFDTIATFEIFGYQEQKNVAITTLLWKKIGSVKAMNLPMACTLTQFVHNYKYHFSIRAVDIHGRCGHYSDAISIVYRSKT